MPALCGGASWIRRVQLVRSAVRPTGCRNARLLCTPSRLGQVGQTPAFRPGVFGVARRFWDMAARHQATGSVGFPHANVGREDAGAETATRAAEAPLCKDRPTAAPVEVLSDCLERPEIDDRQYRLIRLGNQLEALLIHDLTTEKASAALDVKVGQLSDPLDLQGLAHYCEHLLFMGTVKYPKENEYSEYLSNHSGSSNAFTALDDTTYYFEVDANYLEGALDRFAQFFICPLFLEDCNEREIQAVDSEHKKNINDDMWRAYHLERTLSNPNYPFSKFSTGNLTTLQTEPVAKGLNVRDELLKFHSKYYSANLMKLVVLGKDSLDQLQNWVLENFASVPNHNFPPPQHQGKILTEKELLTQYFYKPIQDINAIEITFPFPDQRVHFESQPANFLSHLIGHEGAGSLLSLLKNEKNWVQHLGCGPTHISSGTELFKISMELTEEGIKHYLEIVELTFQYIHLLKTQLLDQWRWDELKVLHEAYFRFKEKGQVSSLTSKLAGFMQENYPPNWTLSGPYLLRKFDRAALEESLSYLRPDNFRLAVTSPTVNGKWDQKEKYYGIEYTVEKLPEDLLERIKTPRSVPQLYLPPRNEFIPRNLHVEKLQVAEPLRRPSLLICNATSRLWYKRDDRFWVPKIQAMFLMRTKLASASIENTVKSTIYTKLVMDALSEYSYDAALAGVRYDFQLSGDGLVLSMGGFNDKMFVLAEKIVNTMRNLKIPPARFNEVRDELRRLHDNWKFSPPYSQATYYTSYLTTDPAYSHDEFVRVLKETSPVDVEEFYPILLKSTNIESLIHGNYSKEEALRLHAQVVNTIGSSSDNSVSCVDTLKVPSSSMVVLTKDVPNAEEVNSGIEMYFQVGDVGDVQQRALLELLAQIGSEPAFNQLRTKEQLGYIVFSGARLGHNQMGYRVIIQSERLPEYLQGRIEMYLDMLRNLVKDMPEAEFIDHVNSLVVKKLEKEKTLAEEMHKYSTHITSQRLDFYRSEADVAMLKQLKREQVVEFLDKYIHPDSGSRNVLVTHMKSLKGKTMPAEESECRPSAVPRRDISWEDVAEYKRGLEVAGRAGPVADLDTFYDDALKSKL